ncbi:hypothetical protein ACJX0J_027100, partial [Zea mays]
RAMSYFATFAFIVRASHHLERILLLAHHLWASWGPLLKDTTTYFFLLLDMRYHHHHRRSYLIAHLVMHQAPCSSSSPLLVYEDLLDRYGGLEGGIGLPIAKIGNTQLAINGATLNLKWNSMEWLRGGWAIMFEHLIAILDNWGYFHFFKHLYLCLVMELNIYEVMLMIYNWCFLFYPCLRHSMFMILFNLLDFPRNKGWLIAVNSSVELCLQINNHYGSGVTYYAL